MNRGRPPGDRRAVGALESEMLTLLQSTQQALTPGEVLQRIGESLSYSTVVTVLSRMFARRLLIRSKQGRASGRGATGQTTSGPGIGSAAALAGWNQLIGACRVHPSP
ncbi:BlaI/MecI/CopY family transcriptional regulator [Streptomyces sp. NPDC057746]|uniref:BlaI/MecI/CopY family transcriptional regulator n=1 Tax=Streptomyces sp. NPDC057746 TaxID=3346237 RepID=UPI0036B0B703